MARGEGRSSDGQVAAAPLAARGAERTGESAGNNAGLGLLRDQVKRTAMTQAGAGPSSRREVSRSDSARPGGHCGCAARVRKAGTAPVRAAGPARARGRSRDAPMGDTEGGPSMSSGQASRSTPQSASRPTIERGSSDCSAIVPIRSSLASAWLGQASGWSTHSPNQGRSGKRRSPSHPCEPTHPPRIAPAARGLPNGGDFDTCEGERSL